MPSIYRMKEKKVYTFEEIKQKMAKYCAYQDRSHQEVEQKMFDFKLIPEAKEEIILYLLREDFLNEERFVRSYIRGKFYMKQWGRGKIKSRLKSKGVSEKLINSCFNEIAHEDYMKTIENIYTQYYQKQKGLKEYQKKSKTITYLLSKGYEYDLILEIQSQILQ